MLCLGERLLCGRQVGAGLTHDRPPATARSSSCSDGREDVALFDRFSGRNDVDASDLAAHLGWMTVAESGCNVPWRRSDPRNLPCTKIGDGLHRLPGLFTQMLMAPAPPPMTAAATPIVTMPRRMSFRRRRSARFAWRAA
ncbi:MAG: hypothetical protein ACLTSX_00730 [Collinsella sp.]